MAKKTQQDDLGDINFDVPAGPGFEQVKAPALDANETARLMTSTEAPIGPVAMPEEHRNVHPRPIHPIEGPRAHRPVSEIIERFIEDIRVHPDAHFLSSSLDGPADESECQVYPDAPQRSLRVDTLRIIRRTTGELAPAMSNTQARRKWQDEVIAGHVESMRAQQESHARRKKTPEPAVDPATIAAIVAATVQALKTESKAATA